MICMKLKYNLNFFISCQILAPLCFCDGGDEAGGKDDGCKKVLAAITKVGEDRQTERFLPIVNGIVKTDNPELRVSCSISNRFSIYQVSQNQIKIILYILTLFFLYKFFFQQLR